MKRQKEKRPNGIDIAVMRSLIRTALDQGAGAAIAADTGLADTEKQIDMVYSLIEKGFLYIHASDDGKEVFIQPTGVSLGAFRRTCFSRLALFGE